MARKKKRERNPRGMGTQPYEVTRKGVVTGWRAAFELPPGPNGTRRRKVVNGATEAEVVRKLEAAKRETPRTPPTEAGTLADWLPTWLSLWVAPNVETMTLANYTRWVTADVLTHPIARRPMNALTSEDYQTMLSALHSRAPALARNVRAMLIGAIERARKSRKVTENVVKDTELPTYRPARISLTVQEVQRLITAVEGDPLGVALWLALSGLRRGEICGLLWSDVELDAARLTVRRSLVQPKGAVIEKKPKTPTSARAVYLFPQAVAALRTHRAAQTARALKDGHDTAGRVLTTNDGRLISPAMLDAWYDKVRTAASVGGTLHSLRRTVATLAQQHGASYRDVQAQLGHSAADMTMLYTDSTEDGQRDAADRLGKVLPWPKTGT